MEKDKTTEDRIKETAKEIFQQKGYGLTRTREIAEAAGINTALLNYYFRSKENLFNIVMIESLQDIFSFVRAVISDQTTSLSHKIGVIVNQYIDIFKANPHLPLFILSELQAHPERLMQKTGLPNNLLRDSYFFKQLREQLEKESINISPIHIFMNTISLTILPIVGKSLVMHTHEMNDAAYVSFLEERRLLIPMWIKAMLKLHE